MKPLNVPGLNAPQVNTTQLNACQPNVSQLNRPQRRAFTLNQSGQLAIETVLILSLFVSLMLFTASQLRQNEVFSRLVEGPWQQLAGLIKNGAWGSIEDTNVLHPSHFHRHATLQPKEVF